MGTVPAGYALGRSTAETRRLELQAAIYQTSTTTLIAAAGIRAGQTVVDVGCGAGDVTLALAAVVGERGTVVAVDNDPEMIGRAGIRAAGAGLHNIRFCMADARRPPVAAASVDAVVGRLIAVHLDSPVTAVTTLAGLLRPGGTLLMMEFNASRSRAVPEVASFTAAVATISAALRSAGADPDMGLAMPAVLREAGFPRVGVLAMTPASDEPALAAEYASMTLESLAPLLARSGLDGPPAGLAEQIRRDLERAAATVYFSELVGVWGTL